MVVCEEIDGAEVHAFRSCGSGKTTSAEVGESVGVAEPVCPQSSEQNAGRAIEVHKSCEADGALEALKWSTGFKDDSVLRGLLVSLPDPIINEQIRLHQDSKAAEAPPKPKTIRVVVRPQVLQSRDAVAKAFEEYLVELRCAEGGKLAHGAMKEFVRDRLQFSGVQAKDPGRQVRQWHKKWILANKNHPQSTKAHHKSAAVAVPYKLRQRAKGLQGRPYRAPLVRQLLYEWFVSMRYAVDWTKFNQVLKAKGKIKCIGRFPRSLLRLKVKQLLQEYCFQSLLHGQRPQVFEATSKWFSVFEADYGLTLRTPNRRFKAPRHVLMERLKIFWINVFRLRALCVAANGYDLEMENFDQSPYHANEVGSQNQKTLAVAGACEVPLVEGHADTRERWTGNFTTFSDKQRIMDGEIPYVELMFKAEGQLKEARLREHARSRGYGPWLSIATSPKGSYREADVLNFLERHLPASDADRHWRVLLADDFAAHKSDNVSRLCWNRKYVDVIHAPCATAVAQTVDTDLNQHVRRDYSALESEELISQMRAGTIVPKAHETVCIDMMVQVLSKRELHLAAAEGYKKTGQTVALNGTEDHLIVREAGEFWREMGMRNIINKEIENVTSEVRAGRLTWSRASIKRLRLPYAVDKEMDAIFERCGDHNWLEEGDKPYEVIQDVEGGCDDGASNDSNEENNADDVAGRSSGDVVLAVDINSDARSGGKIVPLEPSMSDISIDQSDSLQMSTELVDTLQQALTALQQSGAIAAAVNLQNEIRKERRRQRGQAREDTAVAEAMARHRDAEEAEAMKQRRLVADLNQRQGAADAAKKEAHGAAALLKKRKAELVEVEALLESAHALKRFTPDTLGQGNARGGGAVGRKRRYEVMERLARHGVGLSAAQKNDWPWFKEAWDAKMLDTHKDDWGGKFATYMQKLLDDIQSGRSDALSKFIYSEPRRCFDAEPGLLV